LLNSFASQLVWNEPRTKAEISEESNSMVSASQLGSLSLFFFFFFGGIGVWNQGFRLTKKALYCLTTSPIHSCSGYFGDGESLELFAQDGLELRSSWLQPPMSLGLPACPTTIHQRLSLSLLLLAYICCTKGFNDVSIHAHNVPQTLPSLPLNPPSCNKFNRFHYSVFIRVCRTLQPYSPHPLLTFSPPNCIHTQTVPV
jgi:hypothetical protein